MTPITGCEALPVEISWSAVLRAWSLGIAKPTPMLPDPLPEPLPGTWAMAELTPITRPGHVEQRAAGVARVDRGVGLDRVDERLVAAPHRRG